MDRYKTGDVILGKYEVKGTLGKGGMGYVLAAQNLATGELVALKFLLASLRNDPEVSARFDQEARTAIRIKSPHVARVLDVVAADDGPFIVMEHLIGEDLAAVLRQRGQLPVAEAVGLLMQACEAIHEAHLEGVVHRDLKPSNLFVTTSAHGLPFIKVLDFGIAKSRVGDVSMTESRAVMGSPRYMSPEQLMSPRDVDGRADIWSLGVILYEMLAAAPPFPGDTYATVSAAILKGDYAKLSTHRADVSPELEEALADALQADRRKRVPTVEAWAAKLAGFGTEAARQTYGHIQSRAAYARVELAAANATLPNGEAGSEVERTVADPGTAPPVAESQALLAPSRRRGVKPALGVLAVALGAAVVVPQYLAHRARPSPATTPDVGVPAHGALGFRTAACAEGATPSCEAACASKVPGTCEDLGRGLEKGLGAGKDLARAATVYRADCDAGGAGSCNRLGGLYETGKGVPQDAAKAVGFYDTACRAQHAAGCVNLGTMHYEGRGVPKNQTLGAEYFLSGCEAGEPLGCANVSAAYAAGHGVPKDVGQAFAFAKRACDGGAVAGCVQMSAARLTGDGVAKDVKRGLADLEEMCAASKALACEKLMAVYASGLGSDLAADPLRARGATDRACKAGSETGCGLKKVAATANLTGTAPAQAMKIFEDSCNHGSLVGCAMLGQTLIEGSGGTVDRPRGLALLQRACEGQAPTACEKLAAATR